MAKYLLKRIGQSLLTLMIILVVVFIMVRQMPIDGYFDNIDKLDDAVIQATLDDLGLKDPMVVQLKNFFARLLHGDLGKSTRYSRDVPITEIIAAKAPISIQMGLLSMAVSMLLGIPLGAAMARSKNRFWDKFGTVFIVLVNAVPSAVYYIYIQSFGSSLLGVEMLFDSGNWVYWILPVFSMSLGNIAYYAMWLRRYMVDESKKDYITLARIKGVSENKIFFGHVFRNAFVPMAQYLPTSFLNTVIGSIYIESLYSIPGMGGLLVDVVKKQDNAMVLGIVLLYATVGIIGLLLGDLMMALLDPRINLTKKGGER